MMYQQSLLILIVIIVSGAVLSLAQDDAIYKVYPANISCNRNATIRRMERNEINLRTGRTTLYRACYTYKIIHDKNNEPQCELLIPEPFSEVIDEIPLFTVTENSSLLFIETPVSVNGTYFNDTICYFIVGNKRAGFVYQYYEGWKQDLQGVLNITEETINNNVIQQVHNGTCQDFFEFREKSVGIPNNALVTCGNETDPRLQLGVDVANALTLVFMSDGSKQRRGVNLTVFEINGTAATLYNPTSSRKRRSDVLAPTGQEGRQGDRGVRGVPGKAGRHGNDGVNGRIGLKGERGVSGVRGPNGPPGTIAGNRGDPGVQGPRGPKGIPCKCEALKTCKAGQKGAVGLAGPIGFRGAPGTAGSRGLPGETGPRGYPGDIGRKGQRGFQGFNGLDGPPGDPGPPGDQGLPGLMGPPGLGGCPLPKHEKVTRRMIELGYITEVTEDIYYNTADEQDKESVRTFHNHLVKEFIQYKEDIELSNHDTHSRVNRQAESSIRCKGVPVIPGPTGEAGIPGLGGAPGQSGIPGRPGLFGSDGLAGDPGDPGLEGAKGMAGSRGLRGKRGEDGEEGEQGDPGQCNCYKDQSTSDIPTKRESLNQPVGFGLKGQRGSKGVRGPTGPKGHKGNDGTRGQQGSRGPKGFRGADGVFGKTGPFGLPGPKGPLGPKGPRGITGPPGPPGPPGCACNNIKIFQDRYGFLRKPSLIPSNKENNITEELTLIEVNITCVRVDDGPPIVGRRGEQGLPGVPGARGFPGQPGFDGRDGLSGNKGIKGTRGYNGPQGYYGLRGPPGEQGIPGSPGLQGQRGNSATCILNSQNSLYSNVVATHCSSGCANGPKGVKGNKGSIGPRGYPGIPGSPGYPGPRGPRGMSGTPGVPGDEGLIGYPGHQGLRGPPGLQGPPGDAGPPGPPGPSDKCPEYDGVDFDVFFSPTTEEVQTMRSLIRTSNMELAMERTRDSYPVLRELANFIANGNRLPVQCIEIISKQVNNNSVIVEFSGNAPFTCQVGNGQPLPCTSPYTFTNLPEGRNTITISGVIDSLQSVCSKRFDIVIKEMTCFSLVSYKISGAQLNFDFSGNYKFYCRFDTNEPLQCTSPWVITGVTAGKHQVTFWDVNTNGNRCYRQYNVTVKSQLEVNSPIVTCDSVTVTFTTNSNTQCQLDSDSFTDCQSPYHQSGLDGGGHIVTIRTYDGLNAKSVSFTIQDPIQLHISPPVVSFSTVKISFNSSTASAQCKLDNFAFSPCTSPYQQINLNSGEHTVTIKATDNAGCVKQNSITFYIGVAVPPKITLISVTRKVGTNCILVDYSLSQSAITDCSHNNTPWIRCTSPFSLCQLQKGVHIVSIRATNRAKLKSTLRFSFTLN